MKKELTRHTLKFENGRVIVVDDLGIETVVFEKGDEVLIYNFIECCLNDKRVL